MNNSGFLAKNVKAVAAFVATAIVAFALKVGLQLDETELTEVLGSLIAAAVSSAVVWFSPKNSDS